MTDPFYTGPTKYGTLGGVITILLYNVTAGDIIRTGILAAIGAFVSFFISLALRYCIRKWRK